MLILGVFAIVIISCGQNNSKNYNTKNSKLYIQDTVNENRLLSRLEIILEKVSLGFSEFAQ